MQQEKTEILVIGSGIAGLVFALACAEKYQVHILCKGSLIQGNTELAQGGIAAALDWPDESVIHIQDTLEAGCGICDEEAVRFLIDHAAEAIGFLENQGLLFQRNSSGAYDLALEAAHRLPRVLHVQDQTGKVLIETLLNAVLRNSNISYSENCYVENLVLQNNRCIGASYFENGKQLNSTISASVTMLAAGGAGQLYSLTSNSEMASGDGYALAYDAGAKFRNMEFVQFHPTVLHSPRTKPFLISEALRGAGAVLCDETGNPFMDSLHPQGSLAPRDFVCRAIYDQMKRSKSSHVYLDIRKKWTAEMAANFSTIAANCFTEGIDPKKDLIPVIPAAHYLCGGIQTDLYGQSSIAGLYASGENACTGVHGANRLASNSLLEAVVFSLSAGRKLLSSGISKQTPLEYPTKRKLYKDKLSEVIYQQIHKKLQHIMTHEVGIIRTKVGLVHAEMALSAHLHYVLNQESGPLSLKRIQLKQMLTTALIVVRAAKHRTKSVGNHFMEI